jgi:hypothetical protein
MSIENSRHNNRMEIDLHDLGIPVKGPLRGLHVPHALLPQELITGDLRCPDRSIRCNITYKERVNHGSYGVIQRVLRASAATNNQILVCKKPTPDNHSSFILEAIVQWLARKTFEQFISAAADAVPQVHDIYTYGDECRFTMDYVDGHSALEEIYRAANPDLVFLQCMAQLSLLLGVLEETIHLDHRDLKMTNLWIRRRPISYTATVGGRQWTLTAPFQLVLLDFGFACIGDGAGKAIVNSGDVIPDIDPCPKDGRDIYQCILSLWSVAAVRERLSAGMQDVVKGWMEGSPKGSLKMAESGSLGWTYMITSSPEFEYPPLHPARLLATLSASYGEVVSAAL